MRKVGFFLFATALMTLNGCKDDAVVEQNIIPVQEGDEINFGSSLNTTESRTIYDDVPTTGEGDQQYYRVFWEADGSDQIAIYCPQATAPGQKYEHLVKYSVDPDDTDPTHSSLVTKVDPDKAGLQWGADVEHHFYGFYPASAVTGTEDGKIEGEVLPTQNVTKWEYDSETKTWYGTANTDYAYMWAYGSAVRSKIPEGGSVPLTFHPWMTILEIEVNGPEEGSLKVSNINVRAVGGTQTVITGRFVCDMTPVENGTAKNPRYEVVGNQSEVRNNISISCWNSAERDFIELQSGEKMVVRAFLLPIDDEHEEGARNLQVRVQPMNGAVLTRTLGYSSSTNPDATVAPHKVNRVILPPLRSAGTNYWMSSLDRGIYLSELSIPGSKFSYLTSTNAGDNAAFQGEEIEQQFLDGVRGFIVQVGANATYNATRTGGSDWNPSYDYTYTNATLPIFCGGGDDLSAAITHIAKALETAETSLNQGGQDRNLECAVVMITYTGNEAVSADFTGDGYFHSISDVGGAEHVWMDAIANELKQLGEDVANRIYTDEITANTTLDDVKGKIILKVNTNSDAQNEYIAANDDVPALFSRWNGATNTVPLRWGSPNTNSTRTPLKWMYQEATHVGTGTEITPANKYAYAINIFTNSVGMYEQNDAHDTWFMNDCGGTFHGKVSGTNGYDGNYGDGDRNDESPIAFAQWFNPQITSYLQQRDENASLGLVFFNFADKQTTGQQYGTDNLIQTIIDNNFKFNLRTETRTDDSGTATQAADASYASGGSVWQ